MAAREREERATPKQDVGRDENERKNDEAMVLGRYIFVGDVTLWEEGSEVGRGFVIEREVRRG